MTEISLTIQTAQVNALLDKALKIGDTEVLMGRLGRVLVSDIDFNFKLSRAPDGSPWAPIKHRKGQPLRDTGRLRNSITYKADKDSVEVGTNVEYAPVHQFGLDTIVDVKAHTMRMTQVFGKKLPEPIVVNVKAHQRKAHVKARPFIGIEKRQVDLINAQLDRWSKEVLGVN